MALCVECGEEYPEIWMFSRSDLPVGCVRFFLGRICRIGNLGQKQWVRHPLRPTAAPDRSVASQRKSRADSGGR